MTFSVLLSPLHTYLFPIMQLSNPNSQDNISTTTLQDITDISKIKQHLIKYKNNEINFIVKFCRDIYDTINYIIPEKYKYKGSNDLQRFMPNSKTYPITIDTTLNTDSNWKRNVCPTLVYLLKNNNINCNSVIYFIHPIDLPKVVSGLRSSFDKNGLISFTRKHNQ